MLSNFIHKALPSLFNALLITCLASPLYFLHSYHWFATGAILLWFLYCAYFQVMHQNRCLGMMLCKTKWKQSPTAAQATLYNLLYTISFTTLFVSIWFPFDLFLINILFLQVPTIVLTGTTVHGYISSLESTTL